MGAEGAEDALPERDLAGEVERWAAAEGDRRHGLELIAGPGERLLEAQREQHDARDQRIVEVAVGVAGEGRLLARRRLAQPALANDRDDVEVRPPEGRYGDDAEQSRKHLPGRQGEPRRRADCEHRLAERDQHDQPVALREVARVEVELLGAEQQWGYP